MLSWYLLLGLFKILWIFIALFVLDLLFLLVIWVEIAMGTCNYSGSMFDEDKRKRDSDAEKNYKLFCLAKRPIWYILLGILGLVISLWPSKDMLLQAYALSEVSKFMKNNPTSGMNPQNILQTFGELFSLMETGVSKLLELLKGIMK